MRRLTLIRLLFCVIISQAQVRIISYNVENLFHPAHDTLKNDLDYTPQGLHHYSYTNYHTKLTNISRVIAALGENKTAIVALMEVENSQCLDDLLSIGGLKNLNYKYLHHESPDLRGIDCALLYNTQLVRVLDCRFLPVVLPPPHRPTREIIYAKTLIKQHSSSFNKADTVHIFVCHLPSQLNGPQATAEKQSIALRVLQSKIDSIIRCNADANIVAMGDMNMQPREALQNMHNLMTDSTFLHLGTHRYNGRWTCLDQFFISTALLDKVKAHIYSPDYLLEDDRKYPGKKPKRCFNGLMFENAYSDHLPIFLDFQTHSN